jgi:hypothetical protein
MPVRERVRIDEVQSVRLRDIPCGIKGARTQHPAPRTPHSLRHYSIEWQVSQSWLIFLPSLDLWLSSWQRKQPGKSMCPMLLA